MNNYHINNRQLGVQANRKVTTTVDTGAVPSELIPGQIIAKNGNGYDVALIGQNGSVSEIMERIFPYPSAAEFNEGQQVWVHRSRNLIITTGGGSGGLGCFGGFAEWGILFG